MQGSSAFQFGRAAYRAGLMGRRQLLADALANVQFRLRGATDADSLALRERIAASLEGAACVDLERLGVEVLAGILPRVYPADAGARPRATRTPAGAPTSSPPPRRSWPRSWPR